ncbi:MAG: amidohydrolase [Phycisphaerales bacterium]
MRIPQREPDPRFVNLRDAHVHIHDFGVSLACLDLSSCRSKEEILQRIAEAEPDDTGWIRGMRAAPEQWPVAAWPCAEELHEAARRHPCYVRSLDIHSLAASTEALQRAGIHPDTPDPRDGVIVRRPDGSLDGVLLEGACRAVLDAVPDASPEQRKAAIRRALARFAELGFVEVHDMLSREWLGPLLREIDDEDGGLPVRVRLCPLLEDAPDHMAARASFENERIVTTGVKIFTDGALNTRTANMMRPYTRYAQGLRRGLALMTQMEIEGAIARCEQLGFPLVAHAIGDAAVGRVLRALERTKPELPGYRIEHAQFVAAPDIARFAKLRIIASVQPCHLLTDIEPARRLLPHAESRAFPLRDLVEAYRAEGLDPVDYLWFGSDAPVVPPLPEDNIQGAVHRRRRDMPEDQAFAPEQAIDEELALACMQAR